MALNKLLRKGVMLILAVTLFTIFDLNAIANGINQNNVPTNNLGPGIFPNSPVVSQFDIFSYSTLQRILINEVGVNAAFQSTNRETSSIVPWQFVAEPYGTRSTAKVSAAEISTLSLFFNQSSNQKIALGNYEKSMRQPIEREMRGFKVPQQGVAIKASAADSPFAGQVGAIPMPQTINIGNKAGVWLLPITADFTLVEPNAVSDGSCRNILTRGLISYVSLPITRAAPIEGMSKINPMARGGNADIINVDLIEAINNDTPSVAPPQPIVKDAVVLPMSVPNDGEVEEAISISEIDNKAPRPVEDDGMPGDINENCLSFMDQFTFPYDQSNDLLNRSFVNSQPIIHQSVVRNNHDTKISSNKTGDRQSQSESLEKINSNSRDGSKEQPFIPLSLAGDNLIVNGVLFNEYGKAHHKPQRKIIELGFAPNSLIQSDHVSNEGGTYDLQRCPNRPRAPSPVQRYV